MPVKAATEKIADAIANFFMEFRPYEELIDLYMFRYNFKSKGNIIIVNHAMVTGV